MYSIIRNFLFHFDAEAVHYFSMQRLKSIANKKFLRGIMQKQFAPPLLPVNILGIHFPNPVGLAAGFDKNAEYLQELKMLGFGFIEIGTVTPMPQPGNDKPRLFRLPADKAIINRMGFNNRGVDVVAAKLKTWRSQEQAGKMQPLVIGGNIGKNKTTPNQDAWQDYVKCFIALHPYVDYFVVNVSSPNTPGLRELQEKEAIEKIFKALQSRNHPEKPILLKIAPDLTKEQLDDLLHLAKEIKLDGFVISNTTIGREGLSMAKEAASIGAGGLSGLPLKMKSTEMIRYVHDHTGGSLPIMGSGGVFTASDAREKLQAGASLIQVYTGFIYKGPAIAKQIVRGLQK